MARPRNQERDKAFEIWCDSGGNAKLKEIAVQIGVPDSRIRKWKTEDNWEEKIKERSDSNKGALLNSWYTAPAKTIEALNTEKAPLASDPTADLQAATKRYVDSKAAKDPQGLRLLPT